MKIQPSIIAFALLFSMKTHEKQFVNLIKTNQRFS